MNKPVWECRPPSRRAKKRKNHEPSFMDHSIKAAIARGMTNKATPSTGIVRSTERFMVQKTPRDGSRRSALGKQAIQGRPGAEGMVTISDASPSFGRR